MRNPIESLDVIRENMVRHKNGEIQVQVAALFPGPDNPTLNPDTLVLRAIMTVYGESKQDILEVESGRIYPVAEVAFDGSHYALPFETSKPHLFLLGCVNQCLDTLRQIAEDDGEAFKMPSNIIEDVGCSDLPILEALEG